MEPHKILPPNHFEQRAPAHISGSKNLTERQRQDMSKRLKLAMTAAAEAEVRVISMMDQLNIKPGDAKEIAKFIKERLQYAQQHISIVREGL
jgi:hypothetical protein